MSTRVVVIHQPDFLPYLGFFHRFLNAHLYISLDHVQFVHSNRSWTHRDKIKTPRGPQWLTVSVRRAPRHTPINEIELADTNWRTENLNLVRTNYRDAPHFSQIFAELTHLYDLPCTRLVEFNLASIDMLMRLLGISIRRVESSALKPQGEKNLMLVDLLTKVRATTYLSGIGARDYLDTELFAAAGIEVVWQDFRPLVYPQLHGEFVEGLSAIDMLFNCGVEGSRELLGNH